MMEINIEKLLENGMSPESIGKMVQTEAQKKQEKDKKADVVKKLAAARTKVCEALWDYYVLMLPDEDTEIDKKEFINSLSQEILELEQVITNPIMQQIFKQPTSHCSCKEQTSEPQKNVNCGKHRYEAETPRVKVNVAELDEAEIDKLIRDFARTLF